MADLRVQVHDLVERYLSKRISLDEFQAEFVPMVWNRDENENPEAEEIVAEVELRLAEFVDRASAEAEFRGLLVHLSRPLVRLEFFDTPPQVTTSLSETMKVTLTTPVELIPV